MLIESTEKFLGSWNSHGQPLNARTRMEEGRFLFVEIEEGSASGCSKDKLFKFLEELSQNQGLQLEPFGKFFVLWEDRVLSLSRKELNINMLNPEFFDSALLFPVWISKSEEYYSLWKKPVSAFPFLNSVAGLS